MGQDRLPSARLPGSSRIPVDQLIYTTWGHRVMLDRDLARIYGVSTAHLNQQVTRNKAGFMVHPIVLIIP